MLWAYRRGLLKLVFVEGDLIWKELPTPTELIDDLFGPASAVKSEYKGEV